MVFVFQKRYEEKTSQFLAIFGIKFSQKNFLFFLFLLKITTVFYCFYLLFAKNGVKKANKEICLFPSKPKKRLKNATIFCSIHFFAKKNRGLALFNLQKYHQLVFHSLGVLRMSALSV
jgi:hypothetical protein